ncbi:hypothetical protein BC567DRAFT_234160 [Phyllosticta citribraziliensis]
MTRRNMEKQNRRLSLPFQSIGLSVSLPWCRFTSFSSCATNSSHEPPLPQTPLDLLFPALILRVVCREAFVACSPSSSLYCAGTITTATTSHPIPSPLSDMTSVYRSGSLPSSTSAVLLVLESSLSPSPNPSFVEPDSSSRRVTSALARFMDV